MPAGLDELSAILFNGTSEDSIPASVGTTPTTIIYGTAVAGSANGEVVIKLDDAIYAADDLEEIDEDEYEFVTLTEDDDDITSIDDDEELIDPEDDEEEIVYWDEDEDEAIELDEDVEEGEVVT